MLKSISGILRDGKIEPTEKVFLELIQNDHVWGNDAIEKIEKTRDYINQWKIESF